MKPTLKQLEYLIALKHEGSFSRAANICFVTQSTLSAGIKELETILGQTLVDRSSRNIALSALGEEIYDQACIIHENVDGLIALTRHQNEPLSGTVKLGVIPTIAPYMLPGILPHLQRDFTELKIQLFEDLTERLIDQILRRQVDVALLAFPYQADGIESTILFEEAFVVAAPKGRYTNKTVTTEFLDDDEVLLLEDGHCLRDHALQACKLQKPSHKKTFSATSLPTLTQMVSHGYGLTLLPEMAATKDTLPTNIDILHFAAPKPTRQIGLAWRKGDSKSADYKMLASYIQQLQKGQNHPIKLPIQA